MYTKFCEKALETLEKNPEARIGQCFFIALYSLKPTLAYSINGTDLDTFYTEDTKVLSTFLTWLYKELK